MGADDMTSTLPVLRRVVSAWVQGVVAVPMSLEFKVADPIAIGLTLGTCSHRLTWHVARSVIAAGLMSGGDADFAGEWAREVLVLRPPGSEAVLMGLRSWPHRWLVTVAAADLQEFLSLSYVACPPGREARLVAAELDMQIDFFLTQGGNPA